MYPITACLVTFALLLTSVPSFGVPIPDSADLIPLPGPGLAHGGIPYGSVSGMLNTYFGSYSLPSPGRARSYGGDNLQHL